MVLKNFCIGLIFLLSLSASAHAGAPTEEGRVIHLSPPDEYLGGLDIRLYPEEGKLRPSAEFMLTEPGGKRLGKDPLTGADYREITAAFYEGEGLDDDETGEPGPETLVLDMSAPAPGEYVLKVTGTEDGYYSLDINAYDRDLKLKSANVGFTKVPIKKGRAHEYRFGFSLRPGSVLEIISSPGK